MTCVPSRSMEKIPYVPVEPQQLQRGMFSVPLGLFAQVDSSKKMLEAIKRDEDLPTVRSTNEVPIMVSMRDEDDAMSGSSSVLDTNGNSKGVGQHPCLDMHDEEVDWGFDDPVIEVGKVTQVLADAAMARIQVRRELSLFQGKPMDVEEMHEDEPISFEVELEILQSQVDHANVHLAFTENMLMQLKEEQSLCLAPKPYQAPIDAENAINLEGQCTGCGKPLATPHVAAMYMLACKHTYHPLCFASLLASGHACSNHCCSEPIPKSVLALLGGARSTTDYESRKFCSVSLFAGQRPPTSEGVDKTMGSTNVTKVVEVMSEKNSAEEMEKTLMEIAAEDGVNAVQKMMEQEVNKEGEQEMNKEGEQEVSKEGEQETVEEIEIDRVPPVYKNPSKYVDVEDPSRPIVLIDLQGVLIYSHFIGEKEAPPDLDANEHIQVEEPPYCYFVRKDAEQFLVLACYFANVFIWSSARLRNVERRVQRLFPSAAE
ncbi:hypothetical protein L7F22_046870 [Adiantum nelumboides]|nr:hypothetical protein [Adiantum nelumboides]